MHAHLARRTSIRPVRRRVAVAAALVFALLLGATATVPESTVTAGGETRAALSPLEVAAGFAHTCARLDNGQVKCWGLNGQGQLGLGDSINRGDTLAAGHLMGDSLPAVNLGTGRTAVSVTAGALHTCARLDNGQLKCWGFNNVGQLGLGDIINRGDSLASGHLMGDALPAVNLGAGRTTVSVTVGEYHTCARLDNGQLKCWGYNSVGQLGLGDAVNRGDVLAAGHLMGDSLPAVNLGTGRTAVDVAGGLSHTCARLDNGQLKCWGYNGHGELGLGDTINRGDLAVEMGDDLRSVDLGAIVPATLGVTQQPSSAIPGQPLPVQPILTIRDAGSATVINDNTTQVTLALQGGVGVLACTGGNSKTAVNGVVTFAGCAVSATGVYTLLAISTPLPPVSTNPFVISGVAAKLAFTQQPSNATVGQVLPGQPAIAVQDSGNGTVIGDSTTQVTLALQGGVGVLACTGGNSKTAVNGVVTFAGCAVSAAGTYTLLATSTPLPPVSTNPFVISAVAAKLAFTQQPSNATVGQVLPGQPAIAVQDSGNGTVIGDSTTQVTLALQGGVGVLTCTGGNSKTAVNGVVTFAGCAVSATGAYTLLAISTPLPPVSTNPFVISGVAAKLAFTQQPSNATVGQVLPGQPAIAVQDSGNGTVIGDSTTQVTLTLQGGAGVLNCAGGNSKTAVNGLATFAGCAVSAAGTYTLLATSTPALTQPSSASFVISVAASPCSGPAIIILVTGANGEVFCAAQLPLTTPLPPGPLPDVVTAIFSWSNALQRFDFWFRGFPNTFQTLANISPGNYYFFQSTGAGQIVNAGG